MTGRPGVCLSTLGPGATNFVTAAAAAQLSARCRCSRSPGQKPIKNPKQQGHFQIVDVVDMMRPLTKYTRSIVAADAIPARVREAFRLAQQERPGAVHIEPPRRRGAREQRGHAYTLGELRPAAHRRREVDRPRGRRRSSERTGRSLMVGAGANRKLTSRMLRAFVDRVGIPFFSTQMGKGVIDETHPLWLGTAALSDGDFVHSAIEASDCIVNVGHDVIEEAAVRDARRATDGHSPEFSSRPRVDPVYFRRSKSPATYANAVWRIGESITPQPHWDFTYFDRVRTRRHRRITSPKAASTTLTNRFPMFPPRIVADVRRGVPGRRHRVPRQRHVQALVRSLLRVPPAEHAPPRQRARHDGRGAPVGHRGEARVPEAQGARRVRRRRLPHELAGARDGGAAAARPHRASRARRRLRDDPLEAGRDGHAQLRHVPRQPRLRSLRRGVRRPRPSPGDGRLDLQPPLSPAPSKPRGSTSSISPSTTPTIDASSGTELETLTAGL